MGRVRDTRLGIIRASMVNASDEIKGYSETQKELYQSDIDINFEYATDVYTIGEELVFGSMNFMDTRVRIVHIVQNNVARKLGDDFKELIFQDMQHAKGMGMRYFFNNNYWITINSDYYHYVTASTIIRRCNNTANWILSNGEVHQEVCNIEYADKNNTFDQNENIGIPRGDITVTLQYNQYTKLISVDDRLIFNGQAFRCRYVDNYLRGETLINDSSPLVYLTMIKDNISVEDDLINNVANANRYEYSVSINETMFEQSIGFTGFLTATVKLNGDVVNLPVEWESDNELIGTIDNSGLISLLSNGIVTFTCKLQQNNLVSDSLQMSVVTFPTPMQQVVITPMQDKILQSHSVIYDVYLYENDNLMPDTFSITASGVPSSYYVLTIINGNQFRISNIKMFDTNLLTIKCESNISGAVSYLDVSLRGAW